MFNVIRLDRPALTGSFMALEVKLFFEVGDFLDSPNVSSAIEWSGNPNFNETVDHFFAEHVAGKAQNVQIVMPSAHFGGQFVGYGSGPDPGKLVGHDTHSQTGSANQDSQVRFPGADFPGHLACDVRVIDRSRLFRRRTMIFHRMPKLPNHIAQLHPNQDAVMVAAEGDIHEGKDG